jgi:hypothetical protein
MKRTLIAATCGVVMHCTASAQYAPQPSSPRMAAPQAALRGQQLLELYNSKYRNHPVEGRNTLDAIQANGLAKTADNVKSIRALLASRVTNEEKIALARILGSLYSPDDKTGMNTAIAQDLRGLSRAGAKDVARAATLAFSRLAYFPDSPDVLLSAKNRGLIDADTYYGELAHLTAYAPAHEQANLVATIKNGKNRYAAEILASLSHDAITMQRFVPETKVQLLSLLEESEPEFPKALGEFGYTDAIRYATWLHTASLLKRDATNASYKDLVMARLSDEKTDPRKIMAFLASAEGKQLMKDVGQRSTFEPLYQRIALYSRQLPQNMTMKELVQDVTATLQMLKD